MKKCLLILFFPLIIEAQSFQFDPDSIPLSINGWQPYQPWLGGNTWSSPEFVDIDNDGDLDLFLGDDGYQIKFFENIGTHTEAKFEYTPGEFDTLHSWGPMTSPDPIFCDIDNDGDQDCILWNANSVHEILFENIGTSTQPEFIFITDNFLGDSLYGNGRGDFADIDGDDDYDIVEGNYDGTVRVYTNTGTSTSYIFSTLPIQISGINVGTEAKVSLCDIDNDNDYDLFIGNQAGNLYFYRNDGDSANYNFVFITDNFANASVYLRCAPTFCDIDGDGDYDLFCGMEIVAGNVPLGDIAFYENIGTSTNYNFVKITDIYLCFDTGSNCHPCFVDIDGDDDLDLLTGRGGFNIPFLRNIGTIDNPAFEWAGTILNQTFTGCWFPAFGDLDADGDNDLVLGTGTFTSDFISLYENIGTPQEPTMELVNSNLLGNWWDFLNPYLVDIDNDGDLDLFVGSDASDMDSEIHFYENIGTPERYNFQWVTNSYQGITGWGPLKIQFTDYDNDEDYDLFAVDLNLSFYYYENQGTSTNANFVLIDSSFADVLDFWDTPFFCDIDNDGDKDMFIGKFVEGGIKFYRNVSTGIVEKHRPQPYLFTLEPCYPNPFNPTTTITFTLNKALPVQLSVYNQLGQQVTTIIDSHLEQGTHLTEWNASNFPSGVYFINLQTPGESKTVKTTLVK